MAVARAVVAVVRAAVARAAVAAKVKAKMAEVEVKAEAEEAKVAVAETGAEANRTTRIRFCTLSRSARRFLPETSHPTRGSIRPE